MEIATSLIEYYNGQTDGFPHVKQNRWENGHLIVILDSDYIKELCSILPSNYFDNNSKIKCYLCDDGNICLPEFEKIFIDFGINPEDVEPKNK